MGIKRNLPVNYIPPGSKLKFIEQSIFANGNYERRQRGEKQIRAKAKYLCECGNELTLKTPINKK